MNTYTEKLIEAKNILGSFAKVGKLCNVSGKAVMKWASAGKPPRTEYSGETNYAEIISAAVHGKVSKDDLLPVIRPLTERRIADMRTHERRKGDRRANSNPD